jgi:hypothetical protein
MHNIVADSLSHHPISIDSINEIHCIDEIFPIDDNNPFPLDFVTISAHQQANICLQQIKQNPTITMRLESLVVLLASTFMIKWLSFNLFRGRLLIGPLQVLTLTMIDPSTNLLELIFVPGKESHTVAHAFDHSWLCH